MTFEKFSNCTCILFIWSQYYEFTLLRKQLCAAKRLCNINPFFRYQMKKSHWNKFCRDSSRCYFWFGLSSCWPGIKLLFLSIAHQIGTDTLFSILIWSVLLLIGYQLLFLSIDHQIETDSLFSIVIWVILLLTRYQTVVPEHCTSNWDRLSI